MMKYNTCCPKCGANHDALSQGSPGEEKKPQPDDFVVCYGCGAINRIVNDKFHLREATVDDFENLPPMDVQGIFRVQKEIINMIRLREKFKPKANA